MTLSMTPTLPRDFPGAPEWYSDRETNILRSTNAGRERDGIRPFELCCFDSPQIFTKYRSPFYPIATPFHPFPLSATWSVEKGRGYANCICVDRRFCLDIVDICTRLCIEAEIGGSPIKICVFVRCSLRGKNRSAPELL